MSIGSAISDIFRKAADSFRHMFADGGGSKNDDRIMSLNDLRPTQISAGMQQVEFKAKRLRQLGRKSKELKEFLEERPILVVLGPGGKAYIIDHHHLALAMQQEGFDKTTVRVEADLSRLSETEFWKKMEEKNWMHAYDENGVKQPVSAIPARLQDMKDDPFRSLAGAARNEGAYNKDWTPFSEFKWADYFRANMTRAEVQKDFDAAVKKACKLARDPAASGLPGFKGAKGDKPKPPK